MNRTIKLLCKRLDTGECEPHVDYVHNDVFLAWEDDKEGIIHDTLNRRSN